MSFSINSNLSALMAYGQKMKVHADNIANMNSEGFRKRTATMSEGSGRQVELNIESVPATEEPISDEVVSQESFDAPSNVDLATEMTQTMICQQGFEANLKMVNTLDDMIGSLLDIIE